MQSNNLAGFLQTYSQESLKQFIVKAPLFSAWTTDFSPTIAGGGLSVTTRLSTTNWSANRTDLNGYTPQASTASAVTMTLIQKDVTDSFSDLEWATATPQVLLNTFLAAQIDTLVNTIAVDVLANISATGSYTTQSIGAATNYNNNSASMTANLLDKNFVPRANRSLIICPDSHYSLISSISPSYIYGSTTAIQEYQANRIAGFAEYSYAGIKDSPYSVAGQSGALTNLYGIACHKQGFALAMRSPIEVNSGLVNTSTVTEESSGISIQSRISYLQQYGQWNVSTTAIYGTAAGNPKAVVLIKI